VVRTQISDHEQVNVVLQLGERIGFAGLLELGLGLTR
jgi:hypothetical protein